MEINRHKIMKLIRWIRLAPKAPKLGERIRLRSGCTVDSSDLQSRPQWHEDVIDILGGYMTEYHITAASFVPGTTLEIVGLPNDGWYVTARINDESVTIDMSMSEWCKLRRVGQKLKP